MKEIIYLDSEMVNSYLAQIDSGLMERVINSLAEATSEQEDTDTSEKTTLKVGPSVLNVSRSKSSGDKDAIVRSKTNSELRQIIFHDYSLDVLIDRLKTSNAISSTFADGSLTLITGKFKVYDFARLEAASSPEIMLLFDERKTHNISIDNKIAEIKTSNLPKKERAKLINDLKSQKILPQDNGLDNFDQIHRFATFSNAMFPGYCLIRINNLICLCPKSDTRVTDATLSLLNETRRKITVLGVVIAKVNSEKVAKYSSGANLQSSTSEITSSVSNIFSELMLLSMDLCEPDDYFIRPIAIYFDSSNTTAASNSQ